MTALVCQLLAASCLLTAAIWTEEDEAQRIAMIKDMEQKAFDNELRAQQAARRQQSFAAQHSLRHQARAEPLQSDKREMSSVVQEASEGNWCYHCTSPIGHLSDAMKKTIKDFLKLRRTSYPMEVSTPECITARNFSALQKQSCRHRYCQTVSLIDNNEGASFVLRGCAENFGAIDVKHLEAQRENACSKLHDKLDISECICKERKYCYANERSSSFLISPLLQLLLVLVLIL